MFCIKCGALINEQDSFCVKCGTKIESKVKTKGNSKKKKAISMAIIMILLICGFIFYLYRFTDFFTPKINLNKYVEVEFQGYNSVGKASFVFDSESFKEDNLKYLNERINDFLSDATFSLDKVKELSNNDIVKLTWDDKTDSIKEKYGVIIIADSKEFEVSGLEELEQFDPFDGVEIEFSGISPAGSALIIKTPEGNGLGYSLSEYKNNLKNGDSIEVIASLGGYSESEYAEAYGKLPTSMAKEFRVQGLTEYISDYSKIPNEIIDSAKAQAESDILQYIKYEYESILSVTELECVGEVYSNYDNELDVDLGDFIFGNMDHEDIYNGLFIIYRGKVTSSSDDIKDTEIYYPVAFCNFTDKEGEVSYDNTNIVIGDDKFNGLYKGAILYTHGYTNPIGCYKNIVANRSNKLNIVCEGDFAKYNNCRLLSELNSVNDSLNQKLLDQAYNIVSNYDVEYNTSHKKGYKYWHLDGKPQYVGACLLSAKDDAKNIDSQNKYYVIYSETMSYKDKITLTVYFPVCFEDIYILSNGESVVSACKDIMGKSNTFSWYRQFGTSDNVLGYLDQLDMYDAIVRAELKNYDYELTDALRDLCE